MFIYPPSDAERALPVILADSGETFEKVAVPQRNDESDERHYFCGKALGLQLRREICPSLFLHQTVAIGAESYE